MGGVSVESGCRYGSVRYVEALPSKSLTRTRIGLKVFEIIHL